VEQGVRPDDSIADTPATFMTASGPYIPHNYEGNFLGNISVLHAFAASRNIPALRLAERVGISKVIDVAHRFGLRGNIQPYLPVALGSAEATLYEQVEAYSVFPNDGIRITPRLIRKVTTDDGTMLDEAEPAASEAISTQTARTMMTLLQEVTHSGTAAAAAQLQHPIGGKTGTTNDFTDAWFVGFSPSITAGVWVGFDDRRQLGDNETGARTALPLWVDFMRTAIAAHPEEEFLRDTPRMHANVQQMLAQGEQQNPDTLAAVARETEMREAVEANDAASADAAPPRMVPTNSQRPVSVAPLAAPTHAIAYDVPRNAAGGNTVLPAIRPAQSVPAAPPATASASPPAAASKK
jgi:penicillin-binding protein 1A